MSAKLHMQVIWVIAQSKPMAWRLAMSNKHVYKDKPKAFADLDRVKEKTTLWDADVFGRWTEGKPWRVFRLMFGVTVEEEHDPP